MPCVLFCWIGPNTFTVEEEEGRKEGSKAGLCLAVAYLACSSSNCLCWVERTERVDSWEGEREERGEGTDGGRKGRPLEDERGILGDWRCRNWLKTLPENTRH